MNSFLFETLVPKKLQKNFSCEHQEQKGFPNKKGDTQKII